MCLRLRLGYSAPLCSPPLLLGITTGESGRLRNLPPVVFANPPMRRRGGWWRCDSPRCLRPPPPHRPRPLAPRAPRCALPPPPPPSSFPLCSPTCPALWVCGALRRAGGGRWRGNSPLSAAIPPRRPPPRRGVPALCSRTHCTPPRPSCEPALSPFGGRAGRRGFRGGALEARCPPIATYPSAHAHDAHRPLARPPHPLPEHLSSTTHPYDEELRSNCALRPCPHRLGE